MNLNEYAASEIAKSAKEERKSDHIYEDPESYSSLNIQKVLASSIYADLDMPKKKKKFNFCKNLNCTCTKKRLIICSIVSLLVIIVFIVIIVFLAVWFTKSIYFLHFSMV